MFFSGEILQLNGESRLLKGSNDLLNGEYDILNALNYLPSLKRKILIRTMSEEDFLKII